MPAKTTHLAARKFTGTHFVSCEYFQSEQNMKTTGLAFLLFSAVCLLSVFGLAQEKHKRPGEDWISLFNGKDLAGWQKVGKESWTVEDGLIHGKGLTEDYGYLETDKPYKDFQLSLRFKCVADGNSGVFFHSAFKPGTADVTQGMQFEIDCTMMHHTGGVYAEEGGHWVVWPAPENEGVVRNGRLERLPGRGRRESLSLTPEWRPDGRFHRSKAGRSGWHNRATAAFRWAGQHAVQRHLGARSVEAIDGLAAIAEIERGGGAIVAVVTAVFPTVVFAPLLTPGLFPPFPIAPLAFTPFLSFVFTPLMPVVIALIVVAALAIISVLALARFAVGLLLP